MIKRMTKITGLLVCVASVISVMPANAADIKSYDAQEGTIYGAKAKGAGIFIDGEINDKDEAQYFMTPDGKYNEIEGVDDGTEIDDVLLNQYIVLDDDTVVDIKDNYKVIDDNTRDDLQDDVASTVRKKIKGDNDDRFSDSDDLKDATKFLAGGSGLSMYKYTLETTGVGKTQDAIYVDYAGNYIDADYNLGSVKVTTTGDSINFKNTEDTYEVEEDGTTYEYKAEITDSKYITDISDYIYRWANLSIYRKVKDAADSTYENVTDSVGFGSNGYNDFVDDDATSVPVLQKFSKTVASDDIDGIKYSKDSTVYFIADEDGASEVVLGKSAPASADKLSVDYDSDNDAVKIAGNDNGFCSAYLNATDSEIYAQTLKLKAKDGFNYIDLGDTDSTGTDIASISTSGGLVYVLDGGYVKAWDGDESFAKVYKVDGGLDQMSIGSKDFMILWNEDDDIYTIINNKKDAATTTDIATTTGAAVTIGSAAGWVQDLNGTWSYNKADGTKTTGWLEDGNAWYYLKADGVMATGWIKDGSTWYYLNSSGAMLANTIVDGYTLGADGACI